MRRAAAFVIGFIFWCLLAWPYGGAAGGWDYQSLVVGLAVAAVAAIIFGEMGAVRPARILDVRRWLWLALYAPIFAWYCIRANLQVVYLVMHPDMPIKPGIVKVRTELESDTGRAALANSITLTPGTLTVDAEGDTLWVHWIYVESKDEEEATRLIVKKFERFLKRIFE